MRTFWRCVLGVICLACSPGADLEFAQPRVRALIPGQSTTVAYATLTNTTNIAIKLVAAEGEHIGKIEFHTHLHEDGMVKMRQLPNLLIPANDSIILKTGSTHLMLFGVTDLRDQTQLTFTSESGEKFSVAFNTIPLSSR